MFEKECREIIKSMEARGAAKSWLIVGSKGVGKHLFAEQVISTLTGSDEKDYNPNAMWIERGLTDTAKKEIQKTLLAGEELDDKDWARKTQITVDEIREACRFLSLKSDKIKIVVFNPADDMNENAQNALLKTLEEPYKNSLILLLSENVGHLLPTIQSRCQKIFLKPANTDELKAQLLNHHPDLQKDELDLILNLSDKSIGVAEQIIETDGITTYMNLTKLLVPKAQLNAVQVVDFADMVANDKALFPLVKMFILKWITDCAKQMSLQNINAAHLMSELYTKIQTLFYEADSLNLDKKQILIKTIYEISEAL